MRGELLDTVEWPVIQSVRAVRLSLQPNSDMLDGPREDRVRETSKRSSEIVLAIGQLSRAGGVGVEISFLESPTSVVKCAELDGNARTDTDQRGECAFVECEWSFILKNRCGA